MMQKDKELLLKDLCARLPYGVKCYVPVENCTMELTGKRLNYFCFHKDVWGIDYSHEFEVVLDPLNDAHNGYIIKPYLRPMSSMIEEEKKELKYIFDAENITNDSICFLEGGTLEEYEAQIPFSFCSKLIDWLNAHHFDYRGLIEKGLAIEVTKENNPYET